jgi:hypothetical protein
MKLMSWNVIGKNTMPNLIKLISFSRKSEVFKNTTNTGVKKLGLIKTSTLMRKIKTVLIAKHEVIFCYFSLYTLYCFNYINLN